MGSKNVERAARLYGRWSATYSRDRSRDFRAGILVRQREAILRLAAPQAGDRVLDLGCGSGDMVRLLRGTAAEVWGVDAAKGMLDEARPLLDRAVHGYAEEVLLGRRFDLVLCCGVLDFVDDAAAVLRSIERHLAPTGRAVVAAASRSGVGVVYALVRACAGVRVTLYTAHGLARLAAVSGLTCVDVGPIPGGSVAALLEPARKSCAGARRFCAPRADFRPVAAALLSATAEADWCAPCIRPPAKETATVANKITEECINCGACEPDCPNQAISQGDDYYVIDASKCDECAAKGGEHSCKAVCPADCIVKA